MIPRQLLHRLLAVNASQRRPHQRDRVVRLHRQAEREHRRTRIRKRVDFATQRLRQFLKHSFDPPTLSVQFAHLNRRRILLLQVRQNVNLLVAVSRFRFQFHRDPAEFQFRSGCFLIDRYFLFENVARLRRALEFQSIDGGPAFQMAVMPNHEITVTTCDSREKRDHAKVAIRDDAVLESYLFENRTEQCPLLRVSVFARDHVADHAVLLIEQGEGLTGQRAGGFVTQFLETPFRRGDVITVEIKRTKTGQERGVFSVQLVDDGRFGGGTHQRRVRGRRSFRAR